jgi:hypothetical protein
VLSAARSPLGAPPRLSFRRPNATTQLRAALPCQRIGRNTLAGFRSSPPARLARHLADRSCCRPGRCPEPPGSGLQIRAQAPHPLRIQACLRKAPFGERAEAACNVISDECQWKWDATSRAVMPGLVSGIPNELALPCHRNRDGRDIGERSDAVLRTAKPGRNWGNASNQ